MREQGMLIRRPRGLADERRHRSAELRRVPRREHREDAGQLSRTGGIDARDARVGVRAPHEGEVGRSRRRDIVHIAAGADEEAAVLLALERGPDEGARRRAN